jgi:hypothetical protein
MDRLESDLKAIESQHHIDPRWQPTSTEYLNVLKAISVSQRQLTKGKLLGVARERVFYLNTLRHHAGYILRIVHVMDTLYCCFHIRWSEASSEDLKDDHHVHLKGHDSFS